MKYSSGDHFEGNWENDKRYGRGIYYQKEKEWYLEGEWQKDILEGIVVVKKNEIVIDVIYYENGKETKEINENIQQKIKEIKLTINDEADENDNK